MCNFVKRGVVRLKQNFYSELLGEEIYTISTLRVLNATIVYRSTYYDVSDLLYLASDTLVSACEPQPSSSSMTGPIIHYYSLRGSHSHQQDSEDDILLLS